MKNSKELAYLRQLCCLGLPKETFMREFVRAVSAVIPSQYNIHVGLDACDYSPTDLSIAEEQLGIADVVQQCTHDYWTPQRLRRVVNWFQNHSTLTDTAVFDDKYQDSELFNLVMKPFEQYHSLFVIVMSLGKPTETITLFRPHDQQPFNKAEEALLLRLLPYVSHALHNPAEQDFQYADTAATGVFMMDKTGNILFRNALAERLLLLANHPVIASSTPLKTNRILTKLAELCRNLDAIFQAKGAPPPSFCHVNGCGRFLFKAQWLDKVEGEPGGLICVNVEHQEPHVLKIWRALRAWPLTPMEKEVALLLAQGLSSDAIWARLHIKNNTLKYYVRQIFDKLGINRREELLPMLLAKPDGVVNIH